MGQKVNPISNRLGMLEVGTQIGSEERTLETTSLRI